MAAFLLKTIFILFIFMTPAQSEETPLTWRDLSLNDRQQILKAWRSIETESRPPFVEYRQDAIDSLSATRKKAITQSAKQRASERQNMREQKRLYLDNKQKTAE